MKKIIASIIVAASLSACGGRNATPIMTEKYGDKTKSCESIATEIDFIEKEINRLSGVSKAGYNTAVFVGGLFLFPVWLAADLGTAEKTELDAYGRRYNKLTTMAEERKCTETAAPAATAEQKPAT